MDHRTRSRLHQRRKRKGFCPRSIRQCRGSAVNELVDKHSGWRLSLTIEELTRYVVVLETSKKVPPPPLNAKLIIPAFC